MEVFSESLVNDVAVNSIVLANDSERIVDLAYASSLVFAKMKPVERIVNPATRLMAALLMKVNTGIVKGSLQREEEDKVNHLTAKLHLINETASKLPTEEKTKLDQVDETVNDLIDVLESNGPILETPSLPHTEQIGRCSVLSQGETPSEMEIDGVFRKSLETLALRFHQKTV